MKLLVLWADTIEKDCVLSAEDCQGAMINRYLTTIIGSHYQAGISLYSIGGP